MISRICQTDQPFSFKADWISLPDAVEPNLCMDVWKSFPYRKENGSPVLRIAAESYYNLSVNGIFIGQGPVRGTWGSNYFDAYDLADVLHEGENTIAIRVQSMNRPGTFNTHPAGCAVIAEIPGVVQTDRSWKGRKTPGWGHTQRNFAFQQGYKIECDFRLQDDNWFSGAGTDQWAAMIPFDNEALRRKKLLPRGIPALRETALSPKLVRSADVKPEAVPEGKDIGDVLNHEQWTDSDRVQRLCDQEYRIAPGAEAVGMVLDFGKPCTGIFEVEIEADAGTRVDVTYGEELWNGRVRASYRENDCSEMYFFTDTYILRKGKNRVRNFFLAHGGSMVQLVFRNIQGGIAVRQPVFLDRRYPYRPIAQFTCSDPLLNQIWKICGETISACSTDTFEDCPWREHAFWVNDLVVENMTSMVLYGPSDLHRRCFEVAFTQQYESGWCPGVAPVKYNPENPSDILPATNLFLFIMLADYYRESGDLATVRKHLPNLKKILDAAERETQEDGLIQPPEHSWNFYDWGFELNLLTFDHQRESMLNSLYITAMKLYRDLCRSAAVSCDEALLEQRISRIREALSKRLEKGGGVFIDPVCKIRMPMDERIPSEICSELSQSFALQSGVWTEPQSRKMVDAILSGKLLEPEFYLSGFVFRQLSRYGQQKEVLRRIRKYWGKVAKLNMVTMPETGVYQFCREAFRATGTYCHGFATGPVVFFRQEILGIQALEPGYRTFSFAPWTGELESASGEVFTPNGTIRAAWEKLSDGSLRASLLIPGGCTAVLPDGKSLSGGNHTFTLSKGE